MSAAIITIHGPGRMSAKGRRQIAAWMRRTANDLESLGDQYTETRFTARYIIPMTRQAFRALPMRQRGKILERQCTEEMVKHYSAKSKS